MVLILIAVLAGAGWYLTRPEIRNQAPKFLTAPIAKDPIISKVSSTGRVNPVTTVNVGSEISGLIKEIYVDYNSEVRAGQTVALIDPERIQSKVVQAQAELALAEANLAMQKASLDKVRLDQKAARANLNAALSQEGKARVALEKAGKDLKRHKALRSRSAISGDKYDEILSNHDQAEALLKTAVAQKEAQKAVIDSSQASIKMAEAQVEQAEAQVLIKAAMLKAVEIDLDRTVIRSPVDGVVISRDVDVGQTVAASLQAPTLFTIARDLRKMQLEVALDEADIGRIRVGQAALFSVDAFPDKKYRGRVDKIRKSPETVQNVVTYTVIVSAENQDLSLLPGMTANVELIISEIREALKIPNSALRFRPRNPEPTEPAQGEGGDSRADRRRRAAERFRQMTEALDLTPAQKAEVTGLRQRVRESIRTLRKAGAGPEEIRSQAENIRRRTEDKIMALLNAEQQAKYRNLLAGRKSGRAQKATIHLLGSDGMPRPVKITIGRTDGSFTEVLSGPIKPGDQVVVGTKRAPKADNSGGFRMRF